MAIIKAFKNLIKHPIVMLPDLLLAIFILVLAKFTLVWTGVEGLLATDITEDILRNFFQENLFQVLWPLVIFFFTTFCGVTAFSAKSNISLSRSSSLSNIFLAKENYKA